MTKGKFTIGCDPEFFLRQRESGKMICAIPFIEGTKRKPQNLPSGTGNIQRDNVAVEFATNPACGMEDFVNKIRMTLGDVFNHIPKDCELLAAPSANFDPDQLKDEEAQRFGCEPDYDAWEVVMNEPPCPSDPTFRSCGAHIHVGCEEGDENDFLLDFDGKLRVVRAMDLFHGVISTILDKSESAIRRRELYGKAGSHRPKEYGVEYRVLSNYWLKSPTLVMLMYHLTQDVLNLVREGRDEELIERVGPREIQNIINEGRVEEAEKVLADHIEPNLSEDSRALLKEALVNLDKMDITKEWTAKKEATQS